MTDFIKKRKLFLAVCLAAVCLIACLCFFYGFVIAANRTLSPSKEYSISFNRLSNTVTRKNIGTGAEWRMSDCYDPEFLWSEDGRYLIINYSFFTAIDRSFVRTARIIDNELSHSYTIPTRADIEERFAETRTQNQDDLQQIEATNILDERHVVLDFSWPSDTAGKGIAGWCVYEFTTHTITELEVAD